ncbi:MAG TPA: 2-keto-4-pentenoate hydratase [Blastocatellia bacterium]|nr:2-keto-4-pentenoate hydratase [Blastocatellia bacterium]
MSISSRMELARLLVKAQRTGVPLAELPADLAPADTESAIAVQLEVLRQRQATVGGWKIGAKSDTAPILGSPLPADGVHRSPATLKRESFTLLGLELEIAFRFGRRFRPGEGPYSDEEVLNSVESMMAAIEVVSSRFAQWPNVNQLGQMADLQNHGALVTGEPVAYRGAFPFLTPDVKFSYETIDIVPDVPANPAGDPRRLLGWVVNHSIGLGLELGPETIITTGSYTGLYFPARQGLAIGEIGGLPPVQVSLT